MNVERQRRIFVEMWSDSIHISSWRNDGFLYSFHDFSKSEGLSTLQVARPNRRSSNAEWLDVVWWLGQATCLVHTINVFSTPCPVLPDFKKKNLWRINFIFIKFSLSVLLFEKSWNEYKNPSFFHKAMCIESETGSTFNRNAALPFYIHSFIL